MDVNIFYERGRIVRIGSPPMMVELINAIGGVAFEEAWNDEVFVVHFDIQDSLFDILFSLIKRYIGNYCLPNKLIKRNTGQLLRKVLEEQ
jgi:hypothetical protein